MRRLLFVVSLLPAVVGTAQSSLSKNPQQIVNASIETMGGDAWKKVQSLAYTASGFQQAVEQSERPEGPFLPMPGTRTYLKDIANGRAQITDVAAYYDNGIRNTYILDNSFLVLKTRTGFFPWKQDQMISDEMNIAPEFVLQTALKAGDLKYQKDTVIQQVPNAIVMFRLNKFPVRIFISRETDFLTGVEITRPYENAYLGVWGDSKKTTLYSFWNILEKGLHYPLQSDVYVNGWYYNSYLINRWKVNAPVGGDSLRIPDSIRAVLPSQEALYLAGCKKTIDEETKEIAPGVWFIPGPCNTTVVDQPDGLVIIEGSYSSAYAEILLQKIKELYPAKKIKALITTSDAWLHIGGLRPFAALPGITIYHASRNKFIVDKLLNASYITAPDALAKSKSRSYQLKSVSDSMVVGTGPNKIILYTFKTETGERMLLGYFPQHQIGYASDLFQPKSPNGIYWQPHYTWEVYMAMKKRKMNVTRFYAMHAYLTNFSELEEDANKMN